MKWTIIILFLGSFYVGFAQEANKEISDSGTVVSDSVPVKIYEGVASFYDNKFEGRRTSTGERFTQKKMTAACNRIPLNHWVKVTNLNNGRSIVLRINDRMHPKNKRIIDLSRTAASKLGYLGKGLTKVEVEDLGKKKPSDIDYLP